MGLSIGIVGLPNVGKSTTFNALTKTQNAEAANYPFCTIEPNRALVPLPDSRLDSLAKIVNPQKIQHSVVEFVDIAGLVRGAHKGEGLGNQFLAHIKESQVILHIVRCFDDENITHVEGSVDPVRDVEIIETELLFSDIECLTNRAEKLKKTLKSSKDATAELEFVQRLLDHLEKGYPASSFVDRENDFFIKTDKELRLLSNKEIIYAMNVDEALLSSENAHTEAMQKYAQQYGREVLRLCSKVEEELVALDEVERAEYLRELGLAESGLDSVIRLGFAKLGLMSYFTAGVKEVRAWTIAKGTKAPAAAAVIHKDFERGFIRAEVISYDDFIKYGGEAKAKEAGALRVEGKDYVVCDGDVIHFRFNV